MKEMNTNRQIATDTLSLMKSVDISREVGKNLHILVRSVIPSWNEFHEIDKDQWPALKASVEENFEWEENHKIEISELDHTNQQVSFYALYLNCGITFFMNSSKKVIILYYDHNSDRNALEDLKERVEAIKVKVSGTQIGYVMQQGAYLVVKQQQFRPYEDDLVRFLGDEIRQFRHRMIEQLRVKHHSGLYLLHGKPGTGKTSFIKSVITKVDKQVIFLTPALTNNLTSPALIGVLMDNPNSIIIIEDAETVLMKRQGDNSNAVANLLNLTDGFPADFLKLNIICTFNTKLDDIDPALIRKGRLKGVQEFSKLSMPQANELADHLGKEIEIDQPMTLAEVCNEGSLQSKFVMDGIGF